MIAAVKRGVPVRVIHDPQQDPEPLYWQDASNIDWMSMNGVQIKHRAHQGLMHETAVIMHGLGEVIFGSSNWSPGSANFQLEHNFFYTPSMNKVLDSGETFYDGSRPVQSQVEQHQCIRALPTSPTQCASVLSSGERERRCPADGHTAMGRRLLGSQIRHLFRNDLDPAADRNRRHDRRPGPERGRDIQHPQSFARHHLLLARRR